MFERIIVPLDGTPFSEAALAPATAIARAFDASIVLVQAVASNDPAHLAIDAADTYLHNIIAKLRAEDLVTGLDIYSATPDASIAKAANVEHADLIVMTAHPRWKVDMLDDSSTTLRVLARTDLPILVWRAEDQTGRESGGHRSPHRPFLNRSECPIIVPLDGSREAEAAIPVAETLVRHFGSYMVLVRAIAGETETTNQAEHASDAEHQDPYDYLRHLQHLIQERGTGVSIEVHRGHPEKVIEQIWREYDASLVVMASRRRANVSTGQVGSVAARIIEQLTVPVLIVRTEARQRIAQA